MICDVHALLIVFRRNQRGTDLQKLDELTGRQPTCQSSLRVSACISSCVLASNLKWFSLIRFYIVVFLGIWQMLWSSFSFMRRSKFLWTGTKLINHRILNWAATWKRCEADAQNFLWRLKWTHTFITSWLLVYSWAVENESHYFLWEELTVVIAVGEL